MKRGVGNEHMQAVYWCINAHGKCILSWKIPEAQLKVIQSSQGMCNRPALCL